MPPKTLVFAIIHVDHPVCLTTQAHLLQDMYHDPTPPQTASHSNKALHQASDPPDLTDKLIDLWEHASTLYHSFEWADAADHFHCLAELTASPEHKTSCLLNTSLIRARLGEFAAASYSLEAAVRAVPDLALAHFLLGLVEWELRHSTRAQSCLERCLLVLGGAEEVDYCPQNLEFVLKRGNVTHNLTMIRCASSQRRGSGLPTNDNLSMISAELLFEAPSRSTTMPKRTTRVLPAPNFDIESSSPTILAPPAVPLKAARRPQTIPFAARRHGAIQPAVRSFQIIPPAARALPAMLPREPKGIGDYQATRELAVLIRGPKWLYGGDEI